MALADEWVSRRDAAVRYLGERLRYMPVMRLHPPFAVAMCDVDSGKKSEASNKRRRAMKQAMEKDSKDRAYIDVAILATGCVCEGCHQDSTCRSGTLKDRHGGVVPARTGRLSGIVRVTMPIIAEHGDGKLESNWRGMREHPNAAYRCTYTHAMNHMKAPKGQPLYLYGRLLCVAMFDMHIVVDAGGIRDYGNASDKITLVNEIY